MDLQNGPLPRTKIVATVGPATNSKEKLQAIAGAGVSIFRLNFSHGEHEQKAEFITWIRELAKDIGRPLSILADLSGPKLRIGMIPGDAIELSPGDEIRLTDDQNVTATDRFYVNVPNFHQLIQPGRLILLDDGLVTMRASRIDGHDVVCEVLNKSVLKSRKGVNLPGTHLPVPALTEKDRKDLGFALQAGVDLVALSFVRSPEDLKIAYEAMSAYRRRVPLIAKIEQAEALDHLDEILETADGAMVARGDLGIEIPIERVPPEQFRIIAGCNKLGKPVITATQMLDSMIRNPVPTRAEVTDIYNAIRAGTDAVMLSGETAAGNYPEQSVQMMARVARCAEEEMPLSREWEHVSITHAGIREATSESICSSAVRLSVDLNLDAIFCATMSGSTARRLSRYRPKCKIYALSTSEKTVQELNAFWGIEASLSREMWASEEEGGEGAALMNITMQQARKMGWIRPGMRVVMVAGLPVGVPGSTNFLRVIDIGGSGEHYRL